MSPAGLGWTASGHTYRLPPHLDLLNRRLVALAQGEIRRLLVQMPPRHGKSSLCSHYFPAWYLGNNPERNIILTSYEADFAASWGRKARYVLEQHGPTVFNVSISQDSAAANRWGIKDHSGGMMTAGVGGPITGKGANILIIDDPIKNDAEAGSPTYRENIWEWFRAVAYTRLEPGGAIVLIMTRWHEDDLGGRILKEMEEGGDQWEVLRLPALAEEGDLISRASGDPLWPARFPLETLMSIRRTVGPYWWPALYQQRPVREGGSLFKLEWWRLVEEIPQPTSRTIQFWDTAFKTGEENDYSACCTVAEVPGGFALLDVWRGRVEYPELVRVAQTLYDRFGPSRLYVEDAASGQSLLQTLKRETRLPVVPVKVDRDKVSRAHAVTGLIEAGKVFLPRRAAWLSDFLDELSAFPNGSHDDQVDALTGAFSKLMRTGKDAEVHNLLARPRDPRSNPLGLDLTQSKYRDRDRESKW